MAGKNTAVFGIYPSFASVENAVDALRSRDSGTRTFPFCSPRVRERRNSRMKKARKRLRVPPPVLEQVSYWVAPSDGCSGLVP